MESVRKDVGRQLDGYENMNPERRDRVLLNVLKHLANCVDAPAAVVTPPPLCERHCQCDSCEYRASEQGVIEAEAGLEHAKRKRDDALRRCSEPQ